MEVSKYFRCGMNTVLAVVRDVKRVKSNNNKNLLKSVNGLSRELKHYMTRAAMRLVK